MPDALTLAAALTCNLLGLAWLSLAMEVHWEQAVGPRPAGPGTVRALRLLGAAALALSLWLCLRADHASMASLVWIMALAGAALVVAFTLAWCPRALAPLVAWAGRKAR